MPIKMLCQLLLIGALVLGLSSCKDDSSTSTITLEDALVSALEKEEAGGAESTEKTEKVTSFPREKTLYLVGFQWGDPYSFNPLAGYPDWPIRPEFNLMYEQLCVFNSHRGEIEPLLAEIIESNNDFVSLKLNREAKWSDGKPLTGEDVKFTFDLNLTSSDAPCSFVQGFIKEVTIDTIINEDSTINEMVILYVDKEDRNNPLRVLDLTTEIPILPKHVFEPLITAAGGKVGDVAQEMMGRPQIVSGPYNLFSYSNEKIALKREDGYWGNKALYGGRKPAPEYIVHPIYKGNEHSSNALKHGDLDISSNYMPRIWLKEKDGVKTWFDGQPYFKPGSIPMFIINTTKAPLNNKHLRRAMAFAIDYDKIKNLAVSGYTTDIKPGLVMPFSAEKKFYSDEEVKKYGATYYDPARAKEELKKGGFESVYDADGNLLHMKDSSGEIMPTVGITSPSGWTDFEAIIRLAVKAMRDCGIDIRPNFIDGSQYWPAQSAGTFDLFMDTPMGKLSKSMPWARFEKIMSSRNWKPVGEKMYDNIGRWNNPKSPEFIPVVDSLLGVIPRMTDSTEVHNAITRLNRIFMEEQPTLPLLYRPEEFYEFSIKHWTNFPTEKNPYGPPHMPVAAAGTKMLWEIKPVMEGK